MAEKLPPRELVVVTEDVPLEKEIVAPGCWRGRIVVPAGCVCQVLGDRPIWNSTQVTESLIYFEIGGMPFVAWMGSWGLRPYDPQQYAETKKLERPGSGEMPPRGRCTS